MSKHVVSEDLEIHIAETLYDPQQLKPVTDNVDKQIKNNTYNDI